jgi:hypothetical protein
MPKDEKTPDNSDGESGAKTVDRKVKREVKREIIGFEWSQSGWKRKDPDSMGENPDTKTFNMPDGDGPHLEEQPEGWIEDLDNKMYGYEDVTPGDVLDLHCKALIGIESGVVALPKFKTLKIGLQIEGTDLYCTMMYSRGALWVPGEGFAEALENEGQGTAGSKDCDAKDTGTSSKPAPTPRKPKRTQTAEGKKTEKTERKSLIVKGMDGWLQFGPGVPMAHKKHLPPSFVKSEKRAAMGGARD